MINRYFILKIQTLLLSLTNSYNHCHHLYQSQAVAIIFL